MRRHAWIAAALGLPLFAVGLALALAAAGRGADPFADYTALTLGSRLLFGVSGWLWLVAILGLLTRRRRQAQAADRPRRTSRVAGYAAESVLPVYVLHQPVLVAIAFYIVGWHLHPLAKYLGISFGTLIAVFAIYDLLVRRTPITRFLFGMRPAGHPATPARGPDPAVLDPAEGVRR
jgi:hypothetical protein